MKDIKHTPIQTILDAAEPTLEQRTVEYVIDYNEKREAELKLKAELQVQFDALPYLEQHNYGNKIRKAYHQLNPRREMTDFIREMYKISLRMDLVVAMANYLRKTDIIASTPVFRISKGTLIMETTIERDNTITPLRTQVIPVQGEIKAWHFRYRVETQLPKINAAPYLNWLQKVDKYESEIRSKEAYIIRQEQVRDEQKAKGNNRLYYYNQDIKKANQQIVKLKAKIEEINAANV